VEEGVGVVGSLVPAKGGFFAYYKGTPARDETSRRASKRRIFPTREAGFNWITAQADNEEN
jgi:hypothetical protein